MYVPLTADEIRLGQQNFTGKNRRNYFEVVETLRNALGFGTHKEERSFYRKFRGDYQTINLREVLARSEKIVVTGEPGSGKSILLQYIGSVLVTAHLNNNPEIVRESLGLSSSDIPLPIFVPLNAYAKHLHDYSSSSDPTITTLPKFISHYLIHRHGALSLPSDFLERLFTEGKTVLLLFDGLDEVPSEDERIIISSSINDFAQAIPQARVVVSARANSYKGNAMLPSDFREMRIRPLNNSMVTQMVDRFYQAVYSKDDDERHRQVNDLLSSLQQLENKRQILGQRDSFVNSPLLVRMLVVVHFNQRSLPNQRAGLYKDCIDAILMPVYHSDTEVAVRLSRQAGTLSDQRALYSSIAYSMHSKGENRGRIISELEITEIVKTSLQSRYSPAKVEEITQEFIRVANERGGLLDEKFKTYQFVHLAFQEFLTASHIAETRRLPSKIVDFFEQTNAITDPWWREPVLLTAGYLSLSNPDAAYEYILQLADLDNERSRTLKDRLAGLELAATAFLEWQNEGPLKAKLGIKLYEMLFKTPDIVTVSPQLRALAGRAYAQLGEIREDVKGSIPYTILIPGGIFTMGFFDEDFLFVNLPSLRDGKYEVNLSPFRISKYPVTNGQYSKFIKNGGYLNQAYWTEEGWRWRVSENATQPAYWDDNRWNLPSLPVIGISWYEALAYCNWLSTNTGKKYRLPTEAEWEKASRGTDQRFWPWGNNFDQPCANILESEIGETSIVGLFPENVSPYGLLDCAGNVWEWTSSLYRDYPYSVDDGRESISASGPRCHRGGSWLNAKEYAHCANRDRYYPADRHYDLGFRIVEDMDIRGD